MKYLLILATLAISNAAFAMPPSSEELIKGLLQNEEFQALVQKSDGFSTLSINGVNKYLPGLMDKCNDLRSRSAAAVEVKVGKKAYYFTTTEKVEDLRLCETN